ncbi:exported hypothetical protein [[Clostridium] ultunense Esp]|nr:exported hypothetical protein [[Clostridium] ultunense Esp]
MMRIFKPLPSRGAVWGIVISFLTTFSLAIAHMPSSIPLHFDWAGQPTRYGSSAELWIMYGIFALLTLLFMG